MGERKTAAVMVRLAPSQFTRFKLLAEQEGRRLPEWLREAAYRAAAVAESTPTPQSNNR